jgi:hypothetical protein
MCFQNPMLLLLPQRQLAVPAALLPLPLLLLVLQLRAERWKLLEQISLLHVCCSAPCVLLLAVLSAFSSSCRTQLSSSAIRALCAASTGFKRSPY